MICFIKVLVCNDLLDLLKILVTIILAFFGWFIGHYFTLKRNTTQKRKDIVVQHLIDTYKILTHDIVHREFEDVKSIKQKVEREKEVFRKLENALADIQLFGTKEQIKLLEDIYESLRTNFSSDFSLLLSKLRSDLRKELNLSEIDEPIKFMRYKTTNNR